MIRNTTCPLKTNGDCRVCIALIAIMCVCVLCWSFYVVGCLVYPLQPPPKPTSIVCPSFHLTAALFECIFSNSLGRLNLSKKRKSESPFVTNSLPGGESKTRTSVKSVKGNSNQCNFQYIQVRFRRIDFDLQKTGIRATHITHSQSFERIGFVAFESH